MKKNFSIVILLLVLSSTALTFAKNKNINTKIEEKALKITDKINSELQLNEMQQIKLEQIKDELVKKLIKERSKNKSLKKISNNNITWTYIINLANKKDKLHKELRPYFTERITEFYKMLSEQQKETLVKKIKNIHSIISKN